MGIRDFPTCLSRPLRCSRLPERRVYLSLGLCTCTRTQTETRRAQHRERSVGSSVDAFRAKMLLHEGNVGMRCTCQLEQHPRQSFTWRSVKSQKTFTTYSRRMGSEDQGFPGIIRHRNFFVPSGEPASARTAHSSRENGFFLVFSKV